MTARRILPAIAILAVLAVSFASAGDVSAGGGCARTITVRWNDTLSSIAAACGTTVDAIRAANPGLGSSLYPGQVLNIPTGSTSGTAALTYVVQVGDTLGGIAFLNGVPLSALLAVNPTLSSASVIYPGQVINLPASVASPALGGASTPVPASPLRHLTVTYGHGLRVRTGPGTSYPEIASPYVSAVKFSHWLYRKDSLTIDPTGFVWVEVTLSPLVSGYSTGWIMVRDSLGDYFTSPNIGPKIDLVDP